jgi:glycosyltransferase involved in cell wall biosynthesis
MHVALYTHSVVPVRKYGGTQRVVVWLARGLAELGHKVTLLAPTGAHLAEGTVVELRPTDLADSRFDLSRFVPDTVDILHLHAPLARLPAQPHVFTLHGNRSPPSASPNTIFLSANHAGRHGGSAFVYNGLDPSEYTFRAEKSGYDLFLGRLHRAKGYRWAISGAKLAQKQLIVAGGWRRPSLRRSLRFVGSVDGQRKSALLAGADCLWMPALWEEPFGLTLVEAMLSGTPVLGTRRGALPEIVSEEVGRLADTLEELIAGRDAIDQLDPHACRRRAERWFTHTRMAEEYVRMYRHYLASGTLPEGHSTS